MKKHILCVIPIILLLKTAGAQIVYSAYSQSYPNGAFDKPGNIGIIACEPEINNTFWDLAPNAVTHSYLEKDTSFQHNRPKEFVAINSFDTAKAHFFLHGVNRSNAGEWEYRVMIWNGKVLENWLIWIFVDIIYVGILIFKHLDVTSILYALYVPLAIWGFFDWRRDYRKQLQHV